MTGLRTGLVAVLLTALACGQDPTLSGETFEPIRIGLISSETGSLKKLGPHWTNACLLAAQEVNAAGGPLPGRQVQVLATDDGTDPAIAFTLAQKLVGQDHVAGIIGAPGSGASLEVAKVAGPAGVPQISGTSTSPLLNNTDAEGNDIHPYFFRTVPGDHHQGWVLGSAARGQFNNGSLALDCDTLALSYQDDAYGRPFAASIRGRFEELGGFVPADVPYEDGRPSYIPEVEQLVAADPDCVALVGYVEASGTIIREWYSAGGRADVRWMGVDGIRDPGLADEAGEHARGVMGTAPASDPNRRELVAFREAYQTTFDTEPVTFAESVYDATVLLLLGIAQAGTTQGDAVRRALLDVSSYADGEASYGPGELLEAIEQIRGGGASVDYEGAGGNVDLLPATGDVLADYEVWMWDGEGFVRLATVTVNTILEGIGGGG